MEQMKKGDEVKEMNRKTTAGNRTRIHKSNGRESTKEQATERRGERRRGDSVTEWRESQARK